MRPRRIAIIFSIAAVLLLTGCWDKAELVEFGYAQALAVDLGEGGEIDLTTLFYNPSGSGETAGAAKPPPKGITIRTKGKNLNEAIEDIPIHFGREAKLDHMRVLILGEELSRQQGVEDLLDYLMRDNEVRKTILVLIAEGKASDYLEIKPFIENTIGQQLRRMEESTAKFSSKTSKVPLLDLAIQFKSETKITTVPYVFKEKDSDEISTAGVALLKEGKLVDAILSPADTQALLMMLGKYRKGVIEIADKESLQVLSAKTKVTTLTSGDEVAARIHLTIQGAINELHRSSVTTRAEQAKFTGEIQDKLQADLRKTISLLQKEQLDALGIGNRIYQQQPVLWKRWKRGWSGRFARAEFKIAVEVDIVNTGMQAGAPL